MTIAPSPSTAPVSLKSWGMLFFLSLIWGSSYILIKKALTAFAPQQVACLRLSFSALILLPFLIANFRQIDWSRLKYLVVVGIMGSGIPAFLFPVAQLKISSSITGILNALTPLFTLFIGVLLFRASWVWSKVLGIMIGLSGATLLVLIKDSNGNGSNIAYSLLVVMATICYAISANTVGNRLRDMNSFHITIVSFFLVGIPAAIWLFATTDIVHRVSTNPQALPVLGLVALLSLFGTVIGSVYFFRLVQWTNPVFASTVSYLAPVISVIWGFWDGEPVNILHFAGMFLILAGVYLSRK